MNMSDKKALLMINQPPFGCDLGKHLEVARRAASAGALLMGDGAYFVIEEHGGPILEAGVRVYALADSVDARGLGDRVMDGVELVDYDRVIDLVMEDHDVVV
jgi:sulfur relay protein TusB/DsrH